MGGIDNQSLTSLFRMILNKKREPN